MNRLICILSLVSLACYIQSTQPVLVGSRTELPTQIPTPTPEWTASVSQVAVKVRTEPDGDIVVGYLEAGDEVVISRCVGDWCKIKDPAGWVFMGCLDIPSNLGCEAKP